MKTDGDQIVEGNLEVTGNITNNGVLITDAISSASVELINGLNVFDPSLISESSRVSNTNGTYVFDSVRDRSGKQKVSPNKRYYITYQEFLTGVVQPESALRAYFDVDGNYVSSWANDALEADFSFIIPSNVHYIEWAANKGNINSFTQIVEASDLVTPITGIFDNQAVPSGKIFDTDKVYVIDTHLRKSYMPLLNKNWLALGDSITQQNKYAPYLRRSTGLIQFENLGVSGRQINGQGVLQGLTQAMIDEADVITCLAGINDYGLGSQVLGSITDDSTVDSFYGDIRGVLETIYGLIDTSTATDEEKAKKLVCFATPNMIVSHNFTPPAAGTGGKTLLQIRNAMLEVCAEFGTPIFDNYTLSGINQINMKGDGLHPTHEQSVYGLSWGKFLNEHYKGY